MVLLEHRFALCSECEWSAAHPETRRAHPPRAVPDRDQRPLLAAH
jgi:hypothetical protein